MHYQRDFSGSQFKELELLYNDASICLSYLNKQYPDYQSIWKIVQTRMDIIKKTLEADEIPSDENKRKADISTLLNFELRDFDNDLILPLFKLDQAFTLLGMKNITFKKIIISSFKYRLCHED